jgi:hypothetical protein
MCAGWLVLRGLPNTACKKGTVSDEGSCPLTRLTQLRGHEPQGYEKGKVSRVTCVGKLLALGLAAAGYFVAADGRRVTEEMLDIVYECMARDERQNDC